MVGQGSVKIEPSGGFNPQLFPISIPMALLPISILSTLSLSNEGGVPEPAIGRFCQARSLLSLLLNEVQSVIQRLPIAFTVSNV
jgi:hypothetical protein